MSTLKQALQKAKALQKEGKPLAALVARAVAYHERCKGGELLFPLWCWYDWRSSRNAWKAFRLACAEGLAQYSTQAGISLTAEECMAVGRILREDIRGRDDDESESPALWFFRAAQQKTDDPDMQVQAEQELMWA